MTKNNVIVTGAIALAVLFILAIILNSIKDLKKLSDPNTPNAIKEATKPGLSTTNEPQFVPHGYLSFISGVNGDTLSTITIELAKTVAERNQGLMFRSKMAENQGMLFVFDQPQALSFWMKNTIISLDILYLDENFKIVSIYKSAIPLSENQIPSYKNAMYVVEVIAGYTDNYNIRDGDKISYTLNP